jgi:hypothetical protein
MKIEDGLPLNPLDEPREARVARGVALLDEKRPGWSREVNPDTLDMRSNTLCVLGQLFDHYGEGLRVLSLGTRIEATRYGFDVVSSLYWINRPESDALTEAWRTVLTGTTTPAE